VDLGIKSNAKKAWFIKLGYVSDLEVKSNDKGAWFIKNDDV
jgi:hypothetical protein